MAFITFRALQYRSVSSFKFMITRLPGSRFCSVDNGNVGQSQVNAQDVPGSELPAGKKLDLVVSCLRVDRVIASGLGMGRRFVLIGVTCVQFSCGLFANFLERNGLVQNFHFLLELSVKVVVVSGEGQGMLGRWTLPFSKTQQCVQPLRQPLAIVHYYYFCS